MSLFEGENMKTQYGVLGHNTDLHDCMLLSYHVRVSEWI